MAEIARRVRVTGRVQGVSFRWWTQGEAERLGLTGWVRNEADGSVTAMIRGPEAVVAEMLERLKSGPRAAKVTGVEAEPVDAQGAAPGFHIVG